METRVVIGFAASFCLFSSVVVASGPQYVLGDDENSPQQPLVEAGQVKAKTGSNRKSNVSLAEKQTLVADGKGSMERKERQCLDSIDEKTSVIVSLVTDPEVNDEVMMEKFQAKLGEFIEFWGQCSQVSEKVKSVYKHKLSYCLGNCLDLSQLSEAIKRNQERLNAIFWG